MKKIIVSLFLLVIFAGTVLASVSMSGGRVGWNKLNIGTLYNNLAGQFCSVFSGKKDGWWKSGSGMVNAQSGLYMKCRQNFVLSTPVVMPTPTPTLAPSSALYNIPVLVLKYFPLDPNDQSKINRNVVGTDLSDLRLSYIRNKIKNAQDLTIDILEKGSAFHGYKNTSSRPIFDYSIYEEKEFLKPVPVKYFGSDKNADHVKILTEDVNICDLVENKGVKEVWLWMYHSDVVSPVESYQMGPYGGVGNGWMELPLCKKTYTVYDYNFGRGEGESVEDHTHHIEALLRSIDYHIWEDLFVGQWGEREFYRCGWTHCPPNTLLDCRWPPLVHNYDWYSEVKVLSDCEDWKPDGSGVKKEVNCLTWKDAYIDPNRYDVEGRLCPEDGGVAFKVWWMQNIPQSWWVWIGDFDGAKREGRGLN